MYVLLGTMEINGRSLLCTTTVAHDECWQVYVTLMWGGFCSNKPWHLRASMNLTLPITGEPVKNEQPQFTEYELSSF